MPPATEWSALARVLLKPKRSQPLRKAHVFDIGSDLSDNVNIVGPADLGRSGVGDEKPGRTSANENDLVKDWS
jgi:hypothetical protein